MLYNKFAVKNRKRVTKRQQDLAKKHSPLNLGDDIKALVENITTHVDKLDVVWSVTGHLSYAINYDYKHKLHGIRNAQQVWEHRKGHCIEQNTLLMAVLQSLGIRASWIVTKNPKGYDVSECDYGVHPFVIFKYKGKEFRTDAVAGMVEQHRNKGFSIAEVKLSAREFVAFHLMDGAEDLAYNHNKPHKALSLLEIAEQIDPNNYTLYLVEGDIYFRQLDDYKSAERSFRRAISIVPELLDVYKAYGDFLFEGYEEPEHALRIYSKAVTKRTRDLQILHCLEGRLLMLGESRLVKRVVDMKAKLMASDHFKKYLQ